MCKLHCQLESAQALDVMDQRPSCHLNTDIGHDNSLRHCATLFGVGDSWTAGAFPGRAWSGWIEAVLLVNLGAGGGCV